MVTTQQSNVAQSAPQANAESKSARKKKAKAEVATAQPAPASVESEGAAARRPSADEGVNGIDGSSDSPFVKELQKYVLTSCLLRLHIIV